MLQLCLALLLATALRASSLELSVTSVSRSNGERVEFLVAGQALDVQSGRGMNIAVVNPDGSLSSFQVFDTHAADSEALVTFLTGLSSGSLVLAAVRDEAQSNMTVAAKDAMKSCGATLIDSLTYRGSYALIGLKDGVALAEQTFEDGQQNAVANATYSNQQTNNIKVNSTSRSAGMEVTFEVDGNVLSVSTGRGMNVAVIQAGLLESFQVFDTHAAGSEALVTYIQGLSSGTLVACGALDDAQGNLSSAAKNALKTCGATLIDSISYRGSYALIGVKDGPALAEQAFPNGQMAIVSAD